MFGKHFNFEFQWEEFLTQKKLEVQCKHYQLIASPEAKAAGSSKVQKKQQCTELSRDAANGQITSEEAVAKGKGKSKSKVRATPSLLKDPNAAKHLLK